MTETNCAKFRRCQIALQTESDTEALAAVAVLLREKIQPLVAIRDKNATNLSNRVAMLVFFHLQLETIVPFSK